MHLVEQYLNGASLSGVSLPLAIGSGTRRRAILFFEIKMKVRNVIIVGTLYMLNFVHASIVCTAKEKQLES